MCCRYWLGESPDILAITEEMNRSPLLAKWKDGTVTVRGEAGPARVMPVIAPDRSGRRAVFPMKWGFAGRQLLLNARTETAASRHIFAESWKHRRCIVPSSWYFEWEHFTGADGKKHTGAKYRIQPSKEDLTWLCGLYRIENGLPVFVVLTREPGGSIRFIHDRMPLIMPQSLINDWICPDNRPEEMIRYALTDMIFEKTAPENKLNSLA